MNTKEVFSSLLQTLLLLFCVIFPPRSCSTHLLLATPHPLHTLFTLVCSFHLSPPASSSLLRRLPVLPPLAVASSSLLLADARALLLRWRRTWASRSCATRSRASCPRSGSSSSRQAAAARRREEEAQRARRATEEEERTGGEFCGELGGAVKQ
eukprot:3006812-Rhodomonas_salina.1